MVCLCVFLKCIIPHAICYHEKLNAIKVIIIISKNKTKSLIIAETSAVCTRVWVHFLFPFQHFQQELPWDISYYIETPESIHNKGRIWLLKAPHVPAYVHNAHTLHLQVIYSSFMWYIRNYARCACNRLLFANHKLWFTRWSKQFSI